MSDRLSWDENHVTEGTIVVLKNAYMVQDMNIANELQSGLILKKGSSGSKVQALQQALLNLGYSLPSFGADGDYGNETVAAVRRFQSDYGITVDGVAGPEVGGMLEHTISSQTTSSTSTSTKQSTIPGFNPEPVIGNNETPTSDDLKVEWGLVALVAVGVGLYAKSQGWLDGILGTKKKKRK